MTVEQQLKSLQKEQHELREKLCTTHQSLDAIIDALKDMQALEVKREKIISAGSFSELAHNAATVAQLGFLIFKLCEARNNLPDLPI